MSKVYLFGDSIGKGVVFDEHRGRYVLAPERCVKLLTANGVDLENHARFGATIRDGYEEFCSAETIPGSSAVIEFGGNDCDIDWDQAAEHPDEYHEAKTPLESFRAMLEKFITGARGRQLRPMLITPPPLLSERYYHWVSRGRNAEGIRTYLGDVEYIYRWQERYAEEVRDASWRMNVPLLDLRRAFLNARNLGGLMCVDGIHPNEAGQRLMASTVLSSISASGHLITV